MKMKIAGSGDFGVETANERDPREEITAARRCLQRRFRRYFIRIEVRTISKSRRGEAKSTEENR